MIVPWSWPEGKLQSSRQFLCGYCGTSVASEKGWSGRNRDDVSAFIYICHQCGCPTFLPGTGGQIPGFPFGEAVSDIDDKEVNDLYEEARRCTATNSFTAAVLSCRKLLMHIAVAKGAAVGQNFLAYVEYLAANGYVPPNGKPWVDHIRQKGNEATHEIRIMSRDEAEDLILFSGMLLKFVFEFPGRMKRKLPAESVPAPPAP